MPDEHDATVLQSAEARPEISGLQALRAELSESTRYLPVVIAKPFIAGHWLFTSYAAIAVLLVSLVAVPFALAPGADYLLEKAFPTKVTKGLIFDRKTKNPRLKPAKTAARVVLWGLAGLSVAVLALRRLPESVRAAERKSREDEQRGGELLSSDLSASVLMYQNAIRLTIDPGRSASIRSRLAGIEKSAAEAGVDTASPTVTIKPAGDTEATVVSRQSPAQSGGFSRYTLTRTLGKGAMGVVHLAHDNVLERDVAVKELHAAVAHDADLLKRFRQEAKVLARMAHPGVVQVYDFVEGEGAAWIVMEFVKGRELADHLKERGTLPEAEALGLGKLMAEALAYAHSMGIVHRDFKPANVLVSDAGSPKIMDFGLAKILQSAHHTMDGTVLGSPSYMSPEQAEGRQADARSDIYSLGIVLYRMLTGKLPFEGDLASVLGQHINVAPVPPRQMNPAVSEAAEALVLRMLAKSPSERPQDMADVVRELK